MSTPSLVKTPLPTLHALAGNHHPALTPMAFVQAIVLAYERRKLSPLPALERAQIPPDWITDASRRITALQMEALSDAAMRELDDEALGWFERRLPWGSYGMLARASISAPELGLALTRWCRHHGLLTQSIELQLSEQGDTATLSLREVEPLGAMREFCMISVLRNIHGLASWLVNQPIDLLQAQFPFPAPAHSDVYAVLFAPGQLQFDAPIASLQFSAHWLRTTLARNESALQIMLQRALPLQVRPYRRERMLVQRVRQLLMVNTEAQQTAQTLSVQLHVSERSLHRQLKEEGASLQALKDQVRREHAIALLLRTSRPIKRVALACGFLNDKSFIRAFKMWTGLSPAEFRRTARMP